MLVLLENKARVHEFHSNVLVEVVFFRHRHIHTSYSSSIAEYQTRNSYRPRAATIASPTPVAEAGF